MCEQATPPQTTRSESPLIIMQKPCSQQKLAVVASGLVAGATGRYIPPARAQSMSMEDIWQDHARCCWPSAKIQAWSSAQRMLSGHHRQTVCVNLFPINAVAPTLLLCETAGACGSQEVDGPLLSKGSAICSDDGGKHSSSSLCRAFPVVAAPIPAAYEDSCVRLNVSRAEHF